MIYWRLEQRLLGRTPNRYRSESTARPKTNNFDYLTDATFKNINRLFALSFKNDNDDPTGNSFEKYYVPLVERF